MNLGEYADSWYLGSVDEWMNHILGWHIQICIYRKLPRLFNITAWQARACQQVPIQKSPEGFKKISITGPISRDYSEIILKGGMSAFSKSCSNILPSEKLQYIGSLCWPLSWRDWKLQLHKHQLTGKQPTHSHGLLSSLSDSPRDFVRLPWAVTKNSSLEGLKAEGQEELRSPQRDNFKKKQPVGWLLHPHPSPLSSLLPIPLPYKSEPLPHGTNPPSEPCLFSPEYPCSAESSLSPVPEMAGKKRPEIRDPFTEQPILLNNRDLSLSVIQG